MTGIRNLSSVAGDHGETIRQFLQAGNSLYLNNLSRMRTATAIPTPTF